ncbi:MAG: DUF6428 family protein [Bacteroidota bacterium]
MTLHELKEQLHTMDQLEFQLPDGSLVPQHFHVTEIGKVDKQFIDCGGTVRQESVVNFQLWTSTDYDHRLGVKTLLDIIELSEKTLHIGNHEIEVEYQSNTIGKYKLALEGGRLLLVPTQTDCLAKDNCGIPSPEKKKIKLSELTVIQGDSCTPGSGCC